MAGFVPFIAFSRQLIQRLTLLAAIMALFFAVSNVLARDDETIAVVDGNPILESDIAVRTAADTLRLKQQEYTLKRQAAEQLIRERLVDAAAKKQGLTSEDFLKREVDAEISVPTDGEIEAFYLAQKEQLGNRALADIKLQLTSTLMRVKTAKAREDFIDTLRKKALIVWLLDQPRVRAEPDLSRLRGNPGARVTIVEFSDFECPYCGRIQDTLHQILTKYEGRVRLSFRDYPITKLHPKAQTAAQAARCAGEQGKFWEYHDLLFKSQTKLDAPELEEHARVLALNTADFSACLSSGRTQQGINRDVREGSLAGVSGTPGFIINGIFISGAQSLSVFEKVIDEELARLQVGPGK